MEEQEALDKKDREVLAIIRRLVLDKVIPHNQDVKFWCDWAP